MLHKKYPKIAVAYALLLLFTAIIIYSVIDSDSSKQSFENDLSQKNPLSTEPYFIIRFSGTSFLITSNPNYLDSLFAITEGKAKLDSLCKTKWPPVSMVKTFPDSGKMAHVYLVDTDEPCDAGISVEKVKEYINQGGNYGK